MIPEQTRREAAAVRLQSTAAIAALVLPVALLAVAFVTVRLPCGDTVACLPDGPIGRGLTYGPLPTLAVIARVGEDMSVSGALLLAAASSLPLWGWLGRFLATRVVARAAAAEEMVTWRTWWAAYAAAAAVVVGVAAVAAPVERPVAPPPPTPSG